MTLVFRPHRSQQPRNNGSPNIARSAIDTLLPRAIRQYENALSVNGFPIVYYRRRNTGVRCTCCGGAVVPAFTPDALPAGITVLDERGAGTDNFINSMLQGSVFSIDRYGSRPQQVDANGGDNPQRSAPHSPQQRSAEVHHKSSSMDDPYAEQIEPEDVEDLFSNGTEDNFAQATATMGCGVCLGTGWVGGYEPSNGLRMVYDAQTAWKDGAERDGSSRPESILLATNRTLILDVLWPAGAVGLEALRLWNNRQPIGEALVQVRDDAGTLTPLTVQNVSQFCTGVSRETHLTFGPNVDVFTHLEIQFEMGLQPVYAEWSRLSYNENLQVPENLDNPSLVISPSLPHVALYDIVTESVYRKLWKITTATPAFDRERQINGWEVTARLLQAYELPGLLPRRQTRVWYWGNRVGVQPRNAPGDVTLNPYPAARVQNT